MTVPIELESNKTWENVDKDSVRIVCESGGHKIMTLYSSVEVTSMPDPMYASYAQPAGNFTLTAWDLAC